MMLVVASLRSLKALKNVGREIRARLQFRREGPWNWELCRATPAKTPFVVVQES